MYVLGLFFIPRSLFICLVIVNFVIVFVKFYANFKTKKFNMVCLRMMRLGNY